MHWVIKRGHVAEGNEQSLETERTGIRPLEMPHLVLTPL